MAKQIGDLLFSRQPVKRLLAREVGCGACVWGEVLVELRRYPLNINDPTQADRWYLECAVDHEQTDRQHVCDLRDSEWSTFWADNSGNDSAHARAERLQIKLATYRALP